MQKIIEEIWDNRALLQKKDTLDTIHQVISALDKGVLRIAEKEGNVWIINEWIKKAILLYFSIQSNEKIESGIFEYHDKIPVKRNFEQQKIRVVPPAVVRYGAYLAPGVVLMPSYVNIGAYVDSGTMVDTWATVGSCAQIGKNVHLSGGVGIGGVLEPLQASPVIIEDNCFIGSRSIVVEGVHLKQGAVLGANVVLTQSTKIVDVTQEEPIITKGVIPENAVVVPGVFPRKFPAGEFQLSCALIIGKRNPGTDMKTSLNMALRDFDVPI